MFRKAFFEIHRLPIPPAIPGHFRPPKGRRANVSVKTFHCSPNEETRYACSLLGTTRFLADYPSRVWPRPRTPQAHFAPSWRFVKQKIRYLHPASVPGVRFFRLRLPKPNNVFSVHLRGVVTMPCFPQSPADVWDILRLMWKTRTPAVWSDRSAPQVDRMAVLFFRASTPFNPIDLRGDEAGRIGLRNTALVRVAGIMRRAAVAGGLSRSPEARRPGRSRLRSGGRGKISAVWNEKSV